MVCKPEILSKRRAGKKWVPVLMEMRAEIDLNKLIIAE